MKLMVREIHNIGFYTKVEQLWYDTGRISRNSWGCNMWGVPLLFPWR